MAFKRESGFTLANQAQRKTSLDAFKAEPSPLNRKIQVETEVYLEHLEPFPEHPFRLYPEDKLRELAASIQENGLLNRLLVRRNPETGGYTILSGHNRAAAAKLAGLEEVPVTVLEVDDDTARIIVTEANLQQREKLLPSEKARAYKMQLDALNRQGKRTDLESIGKDGTLCPLVIKIDSGQEFADRIKESRRQIYRYIRLLSLSPELLELVDEEKIPFRAGVELSFLKPEEQQAILDFFSSRELKISLEQASMLKAESQAGTLTAEAIREILAPEEVYMIVPEVNMSATEAECMIQQEKKAVTKPVNPYKAMLKNLNRFFKQLPYDIAVADPGELEQAIIAAIEGYFAQKRDHQINKQTAPTRLEVCKK